MILLLAHTDPHAHPASSEAWPKNLANEVLYYNDLGLPNKTRNHIKEMEDEKGLYREKALFDYTMLLRACQRTGAGHVAILEDDVLALDGWYHRARRAIALAEQKMKKLEAEKCKSPCAMFQAEFPLSVYLSTCHFR